MNPQADTQDAALIRREAKIEIYRRRFPKYFTEQCQIRPREGPVIHPALKSTQALVDQVMDAQLREVGWIRIAEYKSRQHGGSTHGVARGCHRAYLNENVRVLIIAQDDSTTANLFDMAQLMYESMDADIRPVRRYQTKQEIVLENPDPKTRPEYPGLRSSIRIQSQKNVHAGVGTTPTWLHLSEAARYSRMQDFKGSIIPAIHLVPGSAIVWESAPFGYGEGRDEFRNICDAARSGKSPYKFVGVYWWMDTHCAVPLRPGEKIKRTTEEKRLEKLVQRVAKKELGIDVELSDEQIKFRRIKTEELGNGDAMVGEQLFSQQFPPDYDSGWVSMDLRVFDSYKLEDVCRETVMPPRWFYEIEIGGQQQLYRTPDNSGSLWVWEEPIPGEQYDIGIDSATGSGGDYSVAQVIKRRTKEQVAEYKRWIEPLDYARVMYRLGQWYNWGQLGCEIEGIGYAVNEQIGQLGYPSVYQWRERSHMGGVKLTSQTGWKTQQNTKPLLVAVTQDYLQHDRLVIRSVRLRDEMRRYIKMYTDGGAVTYGAGEGNDDCIMSYMITLLIGRDEEMLALPPNLGNSGPPSRQQQQAEIDRFMREGQPAINDRASMDTNAGTRTDPWEMLKKAVRGGQ
jgi:hypothetical protein